MRRESSGLQIWNLARENEKKERKEIYWQKNSIKSGGKEMRKVNDLYLHGTKGSRRSECSRKLFFAYLVSYLSECSTAFNETLCAQKLRAQAERLYRLPHASRIPCKTVMSYG